MRVLLHHCDVNLPNSSSIAFECSDEIISIWRTALQIMESGTRSSLLSIKEGRSQKVACKKFCALADEISKMLSDLYRPKGRWSHDAPCSLLLTHIEKIYQVVSCEDDLKYIQGIMDVKMRHGLLRFLSLLFLSLSRPKSLKSISAIECSILPLG